MTDRPSPSEPTTRLRVWDLPTRLFHLFLLIGVAGLFLSAQFEWMDWHLRCGYMVLSLLLFRLVWGAIGGYWSRFTQFVPSWATLKAYVCALRHGHSTATVGHNPMGALSVLAMLAALLAQVFTGFMSDDDVDTRGPWAQWVPDSWVEWATNYHTEIGKPLILLLVFLHVGSVLYYKRVKQQDLITPMLSGDKVLPANTPASRDDAPKRWLALLVWAACAAVVYGLINLA